MIWELRLNSELLHLLDCHDFACVTSYVRTGINYYILNEGKYEYFESNQARSMVKRPANSPTQLPALFRSFTQLDLDEIKELESKLLLQTGALNEDSISHKLFTMNICGKTFFHIFYSDVRVMQAIKVKLVDNDLSQKVDDYRLFTRQLLQTLVQPFSNDSDFQETVKIKSKPTNLFTSLMTSARKPGLEKNCEQLNIIQHLINLNLPEF